MIRTIRHKMVVFTALAPVALMGVLLVLLTGSSQPAWSQEAAVILDVLNEVPPGMDAIVVVQGDPVEVYFEVDPAADTNPFDLIQLRRVDDGSVVSLRLRGESLSETVLLNTSPKNAQGRLEVVYVQWDRAMLAVAEENVLVVERAPGLRGTVVVPSPEAPTIQAGIDLVADGGTVMIAPGEYEVLQPIVVMGKSVTIQGAGSTRSARPGRGEVTRLFAPPPARVVDAEWATGLINYIGAGGVLRDLDLSGGDACVVGRDLERSARSLLVEDVHMSDTGRGVLWQASSELAVTDSKIENCMWNAISFAPGAPAPLAIKDTSIAMISNIGILIYNSWGYCDDVYVVGCKGGGIVAVHSLFGVVDSALFGNSFAGIRLHESAGVITDNEIWFTQPIPSGPIAGYFGDGLDAFLCPLVIVTGNDIHHNPRAGIANFGSTMKLGSNDIRCAGYELEIETYHGVDGVYDDLGGNGCGCPTAGGVCVAESAGMAPPEPAAPVE